MHDATDPRERLTAATLDVVREAGIAGVSARAVARAGGFSQALIFYHYDSVEDLLVAACHTGARERVDHWAERLRTVRTLSELVDLAEALHADELDHGNVTILAQFIAGAQTHPSLAAATADALQAWIEQIQPMVARLLQDSVLAEFIDPDDVASLVADAFLGIELAATTRDDAALHRRFATLRQLAGVFEALDGLGGITSGMIARRLRRTRTA